MPKKIVKTKVVIKKTKTESKEKKQKMFYNTLTKKSLVLSINEFMPLLLVGETGAGKTSFIRDIAKNKKKDLVRINLTGQTGVDEIVGKWIIKGKEMVWIDGMLIEAMKKGSYVVFDEINMALPEILSVLHSLLDDDKFIILKEKDGEKVVPHADFRFFATMNPSEEYAGTKELNKAFLSRFPLVLLVEYSENEKDILIERTGIDEEVAKRIVYSAKQIRHKKEESKISYTCSTRDLIQLSQLISKGFSNSNALELSILNKIEDKEERDYVRNIFILVIGDSDIKIKDKNNVEHSFVSIEELINSLSKYAVKEREAERRAENMQESYRELEKKASLLLKDFKDSRKENDSLKELLEKSNTKNEELEKAFKKKIKELTKK